MTVQTVDERAILEARNRANGAWDIARVAQQKCYQYEAEWLRLGLVWILKEHPSVTGFTFEAEFSYDDEGGYFRTIEIRPQHGELKDYEFDPLDDVQDKVGSPDLEPVQLLFDTMDDWQGEIARTELLKRKALV